MFTIQPLPPRRDGCCGCGHPATHRVSLDGVNWVHLCERCARQVGEDSDESWLAEYGHVEVR